MTYTHACVCICVVSMPDEIRQFSAAACLILKEHKCADICKGQNVVEVPMEVDLLSAFNLLIDNKVRSAPVRSADGNYIGILDVRELIKFAVYLDDERREQQHLHSHHDDTKHIEKLIAAARWPDEHTVTVEHLARMHPFRPVSEKTNLLEVAQLLSRGAHRVPVINSATGRVTRVISQSVLLKFVMSKAPVSLLNLPVKAVFNAHHMSRRKKSVLVSAPVFACGERAPAIDLFRMCAQTDLSGMAVVDPQGKLVGAMSARDLKLWLRRHESLYTPVLDFLARVRQSDADEDPAAPIRAPVISVRCSDSIRKVVDVLVRTGMHRVYVTQDMTPLGVIAISDCLRMIHSCAS
ncbi:MAG: hypothetical protein MHM6MM_007163 [Cercozoa sp. M6MM]